MKKLISYVLPVYNEEENLKLLYKELIQQIKKNLKKYDFEFIFVNDGSSDSSLEILLELHKKDKRVIVLNFSRNFGQQMAITAGIDYARGDAIILMDADFQDPPKVSTDLIKKWEEGFEVVYAQRRTRKDGFVKRATAGMFYQFMSRLSEVDLPRNTGDFRLMDKKVIDELRKFQERNRFMRGMVSYVGFKQTGILFDRPGRHAGKTKYTYQHMISLAVNGITSLSTFPLKLIIQFGFFVSFLSFIGIGYALYMRYFHPEITVSGFTFTIISILFIGGVQMIMLGILGTYLGKIYSEVQKRPLYIVSSVYSRDIKRVVENNR